ncbi:MAG: thiamine pyrophosphate-binding protein [Betaproteobacteria bacterium]
MTQATPKIHGGKILANALARQGVKFAFGVPGESFLPLLDGLYEHQKTLKFITCRQEGGAAYMGDAYAKLTGNPGVVMVTRGPGASNAIIGLHTAFQDSTPLVLLIGQVSSEMVGRESFQEMDYRKMFSECSKWVGSIDRVDRIDEFISKAFHIAQAGRQGPVVLALPEDVLFDEGYEKPTLKAHLIEPGLNGPVFDAAMQTLKASKHPMVIVGGSSWNKSSCLALEKWATTNNIPIACSFRYQDLIDNLSPVFAGYIGIAANPQLISRVQAADVILVIGDRLSEIATGGYTLLDIPNPKQTLIHVHPGAEELGSVYRPDFALNCSPSLFVDALSQLNHCFAIENGHLERAHQDQQAFTTPLPIVGDLQLANIFSDIQNYVPRDTLFTNGAGNFATWVHRFYPYGGFRTQLAPVNGSMGYGLPAAVAAKIVEPDRCVICVAGDGDFMMNSQELATAMRYDAKPIVIIFNNGILGTIRMHQEREYAHRISGTHLTNPDFLKMAESYHMLGFRISKTEDFFPALEKALASKDGAIIELVTNPEAITPSKKLSDLAKVMN